MRVRLWSAAVMCVVASCAAHAATLEDYQRHHAMIDRQVAQCMAESNQQMLQAQQNAMRGMMPPPMPYCMNQMPALIAAAAVDEANIFNLEHPGAHAQPCNFVINGCGPVSYGFGRGGAGGNPQDPAGYDMHAIRGHTIYVDSAGNEYELPTQSYYFRNPNTGRIFASDSPYPPNDGGTYEPLQPK